MMLKDGSQRFVDCSQDPPVTVTPRDLRKIFLGY
jgi:hypothetical protein